MLSERWLKQLRPHAMPPPLRIYQRLNLTSAGSTNKTTECPHNGPRFLVSYRSVRSIKEHTGSVEATMVSYLPYTWKRRIRKYQETAGLHRQQRLQGQWEWSLPPDFHASEKARPRRTGTDPAETQSPAHETRQHSSHSAEILVANFHKGGQRKIHSEDLRFESCKGKKGTLIKS